MCPPETGRALAELYGADHLLLPRRGHSTLLEPGWREAADRIVDWLVARYHAG